MSKRSSPRKEEEPKIENSGGAGEKGKISSGTTKLKLRLKVNEVISTSPQSSPSPSLGPKIKLNFSRSNESVEVPPSIVVVKAKGKSGRHKKDKSAVIAAALAASQPNEAESEERKIRRRAAEEKIKNSVDTNSISSNVNVEDEVMTGGSETRKRGRKAKEVEEEIDGKRKRNRSKLGGQNSFSSSSSSMESISKKNSSEFVDITDGPPTNHQMPANASSLTSATTATATNSFNPHENEFVQRSKTFLNISLQHDTFMYTSVLSNPWEVERFTSIEDAVEKLVAFHVGIGAGQFTSDEFTSILPPVGSDQHESTFSTIQARYRAILQSHAAKKVPTELLLLEQRLCLEEEKFLLVKLKNEYASKFLKGSQGNGLASSASSSLASSMSSLSSQSTASRPATPSDRP